MSLKQDRLCYTAAVPAFERVMDKKRKSNFQEEEKTHVATVSSRSGFGDSLWIHFRMDFLL